MVGSGPSAVEQKTDFVEFRGPVARRTCPPPLLLQEDLRYRLGHK